MSFARRKKGRHRLILKLGNLLYDSRHFSRLEAAKKDGNQFYATVVSGGRERERKMNNMNLNSKKQKIKRKKKNNCATPAEEGNSGK